MTANLLNILFHFDPLITYGDLHLIAERLTVDKIEVGSDLSLDVLVILAEGELLPIFVELEVVALLGNLGKEFLHIEIGLFAENEHGYLMVGLDIVESKCIGRYELEHEHDVVPLHEILLLVAAKGLVHFLLLLGDLELGIVVDGLSDIMDFVKVHIIHIIFPTKFGILHDLLGLVLALLIEVTILLQVSFIPIQKVNILLSLLDQRMLIDLLPSDSLARIHAQTTVDEILAVFGYSHFPEIRSVLIDLPQNIAVASALIRILPIDHLIVHHRQRPYISLM